MNAKEIAKRICSTQPSWSELRVHPEHRKLAQAYLSQEKKIEGLVEALKFYANKNNYRVIPGGSTVTRLDNGEKAKQALTAYKEGK